MNDSLEKVKSYIINNYEHLVLTVSIILLAFALYTVVVGPEQQEVTYFQTRPRKVFKPELVKTDPTQELKEYLAHNPKDHYNILGQRTLFYDLILKQRQYEEKYGKSAAIMNISDTGGLQQLIDNRPFITGWIPVGKVEEKDQVSVLLENPEEKISFVAKKGMQIGNLIVKDVTRTKIVLAAEGYKDTELNINEISTETR